MNILIPGFFWIFRRSGSTRMHSGVALLAGVDEHQPPLKGLLFFLIFISHLASCLNSCPYSYSLFLLPLEGEISFGWLGVFEAWAKLENMISASIANIINARNQLILNSLSFGNTW